MTYINDFYSSITEKIIADLEKGELTWRKPWSSEHLANQVMRPLRWNNIPYKGINTIMLWATAAEKGYQSPFWMTFKQALDMKASVRKGEKATDVVYADKFSKEDYDENGSINTRQISFLKMYKVFNASQIEGLSEAFYKLPERKLINEEKRIEAIEQFFAETTAEIFVGSKAAYSQQRDRIEMPPFECFNNASSYYATLAHEITHWTKHPKRLDRDFGYKKFGDEGYAREELVAELGACFLGADLGFEPVTQEQHSAYIQSWLKVLKNDKKFIFQAASHAQRAVEYMTALQLSKETIEPRIFSRIEPIS